jgi:hypothetical protein
MIESSRRHGHFDARWNAHATSAAHPQAIVAAVQRWEDDGGRYSVDAPGLDVAGRLPPGLDWTAFLEHDFPGRRRHDLEALKAYERYKPERMSEPLR